MAGFVTNTENQREQDDIKAFMEEMRKERKKRDEQALEYKAFMEEMRKERNAFMEEMRKERKKRDEQALEYKAFMEEMRNEKKKKEEEAKKKEEEAEIKKQEKEREIEKGNQLWNCGQYDEWFYHYIGYHKGECWSHFAALCQIVGDAHCSGRHDKHK